MAQGSELPKGKQASDKPAIPTLDDDLPRRLIVCFDGTWNKRHSGTNVYHLSNLVKPGRAPSPAEPGQKQWYQRIYYDEGVGTAMLTTVTGGGFGIGLSENVREAYDWLVERYCDGDEIYIFGFSRGAFTARSLVGLISRCGLLYRGAPVPPEQLWGAYRVMGRHKDPRNKTEPAKNWWEQIAGKPDMPFRHLFTFKRETWDPADPPVEAPRGRTEALLREWSRRVPIRCVGIFDTVGSMGLDALAIPWLRGKIARFHDTKLSSLVEYGFHAMAIDEHRANFAHIPWHQPVDKPREGIEQRWFIGAHSNVGGSYEDDVLAEFPLAWMMQRTAKLGLVYREPLAGGPNPMMPGAHAPAQCVPLLEGTPARPAQHRDGKVISGTPAKPSPVRDSFAEIARGLWSGLIRSKRHYRHITPPPEFQHGVAVKSVNEVVDDSVFELIQRDAAAGGSYNPPNLWHYLTSPEAERSEQALAAKAAVKDAPPLRYEGSRAWSWLIAWLVGVGLAASAGLIIYERFRGSPVSDHWLPFLLVSLPLMVAAFAIDWSESWLNHEVAVSPLGFWAEVKKAVQTLLMAVRLLIFIAIACGLLFWARMLWPWLTRIDASPHLWWLLALEATVLYCGATARWCAAPMSEAGFGSILRLHGRRNAAEFRAYFDDPSGGGEIKSSNQQLLMPIAHTILRDTFAFIPTFALALFVAGWLGASLAATDPNPDERILGLLHLAHWRPAAVIVALWVVTDLIENACHLLLIRSYPRALPAPAARIAFAATIAKSAFFLWALLGALSAFWQLATHLVKFPPTSALAAIAIGGPALLFASWIAYSIKQRLAERSASTGTKARR